MYCLVDTCIKTGNVVDECPPPPKKNLFLSYWNLRLSLFCVSKLIQYYVEDKCNIGLFSLY